MKKPLIAASVFVLTIVVFGPVMAQQRISATRVTDVDDDLITARQAVSSPNRRLRVAGLGNRTVRTGNTTQSVREIVVESFNEQETFATHMNKAELVNAGALAALPEIDDEVLEFEDAYVIRRSTTIIVRDPQRVASESTLFRNYMGERPQRAPQRSPRRAVRQPVALDAEERAGLQAFVANEAPKLHRDDPIRAAAAQGEAALIDAIEAGFGTLTVEDTLIIPKESGVDQGQNIRIPTIRNGVFDLKNPEPVRNLSIKGMSVPPSPPPEPQLEVKATPVTPTKPARAPLKPKLESSGKKEIDAEFLLGATRAGNYQWERKWSFPSGYFRLTLGAGYAFGYRVPVLAEATVEPTRGYIRDYTDKKVVIGTRSRVKTLNGNKAFYERAGLDGNQVQGGDELLLEANVGYGYKFRAFWKTIRYRKYTAIGISYSQDFTPPAVNVPDSKNFGVNLDPKTTKISYDGTFVSGSASLRFRGRAWGAVSIDMETLADNKSQTRKTIKPALASEQSGGSSGMTAMITMDPVPLRQDQIRQTRSFGVRFRDPSYTGRIVIVPGLKFSFGVGYKRLKRTFSTPWINFADLTIDTGNVTLQRHAGTRSRYTWNEGEKIYRKIEQPPSDPKTTIRKN